MGSANLTSADPELAMPELSRSIVVLEGAVGGVMFVLVKMKTNSTALALCKCGIAADPSIHQWFQSGI